MGVTTARAMRWGAALFACLLSRSIMAQTIRAGEPFPVITLPTVEAGAPMSVADLRGKKAVLHVFASW